MNGHRDTQTLVMTGHSWSEITREVEEAIELSLLKGMPEPALALGHRIRQSALISGVKLAKLLYELALVWDKFDTDDSVEVAVDKAGIAARDTFMKYVSVYQYILLEHPELAGLPIEGLIKITAAARENQLTDEDWKELELAPNIAAIIKIRNRVRGIQTSGHSALTGWIDAEGYVYCRKGGGEIFSVTFLPIKSDNPVVRAFAESMVAARGIQYA